MAEDPVTAALDALAKLSELALNLLVAAKQAEIDLKAKVAALQPSAPPDPDKQ